MAAGLPVVSGPAGIGGLPFTPGGEFLAAEAPEEFAEQIRKIADDPDLASAVADRALKRVSELFSRDKARQSVLEMVNGRLQRRNSGDS